MAGNAARPANDLLVEYGARPVYRAADAIATGVSASVPTEAVSADARTVEQGAGKTEVFALARLAMLDLLAEPRTAAEVAEFLDLVPAQAKTWLDRLTVAGDATLKRRKYVRSAALEAPGPLRAPQLELLSPPAEKPAKRRRSARARSVAPRNALVP